MFDIAPKSKKEPLKFVIAYRIDDETTKALMTRCVDSGFKPEQVARYALKKYLAESSRLEVRHEKAIFL